MPLQTFKAKTAEHSLLQGQYQWIAFELVEPSRIEFQAGQFIMMNIPGMAAKRSYSIASPPSTTHQIDILVDIGPQGDGSLYLQSLNPGEEVSFQAPGGRFIVPNDQSEEKLVFIATGSGISAIRSMILDLLQTKADPRPISLHWGMRFPEDIFWEEDFRLLEKQFPNFHFDLVLSKAPPDWPLCSGHIDECLSKHYQDFSKTGYYLCGNKKMVESVSHLLTIKGVEKLHIHHELFY